MSKKHSFRLNEKAAAPLNYAVLPSFHLHGCSAPILLGLRPKPYQRRCLWTPQGSFSLDPVSQLGYVICTQIPRAA